MTHDELLAKLRKDGIESWDYSVPTSHSAVAALRAVIELHKPGVGCDDRNCCTVPCMAKDCEGDYPCSTIQAIEKVLV